MRKKETPKETGVIKNQEFFDALDALEETKKISKEIFLDAFKPAIENAYKRETDSNKTVCVNLDSVNKTIEIYAKQDVVEEVTDPDTQISVEDAKKINVNYEAGMEIREPISTKLFGRIAAQSAKQIINQRLREAEHKIAYAEIADKEEHVIVTTVKRIDQNNVFVDMGRVDGLLIASDQIKGEKYEVGDRIRVYVKKVREGAKGPQIMVSRSSEQLVKKLFEQEVPEIASGLVEIKNIVREAGFRTKMAVYSEDASIDPVGACVGAKGARVNAIVSELNGEKIDIIQWCDDPLEFIARAMSPAKVLMVQAYEDNKVAKVVVPDDKLSLAIGRNGQNARLAVKLTGWKIDVKAQSIWEEEQANNPQSQQDNTEENEEVIDPEFGVDADKQQEIVDLDNQEQTEE